MPAVSNIISCPSGQWTSIAQYMETRRALMVQCPEQLLTVSVVTAPFLNDGALHTILAANPLRRSVTIGVGPLDASSSSGSFGPVSSGVFGVDPVTTIQTTINANDYDYPQSVKSLWNATANGDGAHGIAVVILQEVATCSAIILGIVNTTPTYAGPGGTVPIGLWQTPDLLSGPAEFRLNRGADGDLVIQEWFAWPVGSGNVNVQVYQAFDVPVPDTQLTVQIPALSPHGKKAAMDLLAAMQGNTQNGLWTPDDAEL